MADETPTTIPPVPPSTPMEPIEQVPDSMVVVPSSVPPIHPPVTFTLEEIEHEAKALGVNNPNSEPLPPTPAEPAVLVHTYQDDMSRAMNVTDAKVVQELFANAKEREIVELTDKHNKKARGWYTVGSIMLLIIALAAIGYGYYYYTRLTVPVTSEVSVGVFSSTTPIDATATTIESVVESLTSTQTLSTDKPYLVDLVTNTTTNTLLSNSALFSFIGARPTEPFATALSAIRLGVVDTGEKTVPFIITSVSDPEIAIKEFLIAEPTLLEMFKNALAIDTATIAPETTPSFVGEYRYNVPVRALYTTDLTGTKKLTLLYASVTDNIIVITTEPAVLKAVYDTVLRQ